MSSLRIAVFAFSVLMSVCCKLLVFISISVFSVYMPTFGMVISFYDNHIEIGVHHVAMCA